MHHSVPRASIAWGENACKTPCKCCMVTLHPVKRLRKGCMVVSHIVKGASKCCLVVSHTVKRSSKCCIVTLHTVKGPRRCCMVISHTVKGPRRCCIVPPHTVKGLCRCCMVILHTVKGPRRCCIVILHTVPAPRTCCTLISHTATACAKGGRREFTRLRQFTPKPLFARYDRDNSPRSRSPDSLHRARKHPRAPFGFDWAVTFGADFSERGGIYYCMRPTDELWKRDSSPMGGVQARKIYYNTTIEK